jgi:DNA polymerase-1
MKLAWGLKRPEPIWIKTDEQVEKLIRLLSEKELLAIDTETTGLDVAKDFVIFWSLSTGPDRYFLEADMLDKFQSVLSDPDKSWIGSQVKFDAHMLANSGFPLAGSLLCTLTMDRLVDVDQDHGLKEAYEREFNERMATFPQTFYPKDPKGHFRKPPKKTLQEVMMAAWEERPEKVIEYSSLDAWAVFRLFNRLRKQLQGIQTHRIYTMWDVFLEWEVPMTKVLYTMERSGCQLDIAYLNSVIPALEKDLLDINKKINKKIGQSINPASTKQLQIIFFEKMKLKPVEWTGGGSSGDKKPSVNEKVLNALAEEGIEEARLVLRYRELQKVLGTYVLGLTNRADKKGRVHTTFHQHVADTGRLSSRDPNLQNQPRPRKNFDIRRAFIAPPGRKLIVADYDQLEMFLLAHFSNDEGMLRNIRMGRDIHTANVELVWGEPYDEVARAKKDKDWKGDRPDYLRELRNFVKVIGFGLNYGKAANSLARELGFHDKIRSEHPEWEAWKVNVEAKDTAQKLIDRYFKMIPGVCEFITGTYREVAYTKQVETFLGRRRWLRQVMDLNEKKIHMSEELARSAGKRDLCWCNECKTSREGERRSVNTIIQGTAADVVMCAMIKCHFDLRLREMDVKMLLQVHDELMFECPEEYAEEAMPIIQYNMEHPGIELRVPLKAAPGVGSNWVEAKN